MKYLKIFSETLFPARFSFLVKKGVCMNDNGRKYLDLFLWIVIGVIIGTAVFVLFLSEPESQPPPEVQPSGPIDIIPPGPTMAQVGITVITYDECTECKSAALLVEQLNEIAPIFMFEISAFDEVAYDSPEGQQLIETYDIKKLPSVILSKEASSNSTFLEIWKAGVGTEESDGSLVFREHYPPYYDADAGETRGLVEAYVINPENCSVCDDLNEYVDYMGGEFVMMAFSKNETLNENDPLAQEMIAKYNITKLPVFVLSDDVQVYQFYDDQLVFLVSEEEDGWVVLRQVVPPYIDLEQNHSLTGVVTMIQIVDSSCTDCMDPSTLSQSLASTFGFYVGEEFVYDVNGTEAQDLLERYNITRYPTVLVSPDASVYYGFEDQWTSAEDTKEEDGWYVFRSHSLLTDVKYIDLEAPEEPEEPTLPEEPGIEVPEGNETESE
jgi:hypothetical protein